MLRRTGLAIACVLCIGVSTATAVARPIHILGYSVDGRPIRATLVAPTDAASRTVLVVGSIAGDEPGGVVVAKALAALPAVAGVASRSGCTSRRG